MKETAPGPVLYRDERPQDAAEIRTLLLTAFRSRGEADLVERLRENGRNVIGVVAEEAGRIVGYTAFSPVSLDTGTHTVLGLGLAPVAVLPEYRRRGIGSALIRGGLELACGSSYAFVVVLGEPDYYHRFGFATASSFALANEFGVDEPFMALLLDRDALPHTGGLVRYSPEFGELAAAPIPAAQGI